MEREIIKIQNEQTEILAKKNVVLAQRFAEHKNMQQLIDQIQNIEKILLTQGIFLQEVIDLLEDMK